MKGSIKIYRGYGNANEIVLFGHLFRDGIQSQYFWGKRRLRHAISVWKMFSLKTFPGIEITLEYNGQSYTTSTEDDGYFCFSIVLSGKLTSGWHRESVTLSYNQIIENMTVEFLVPDSTDFGLISDIDDTFLISHSNHFIRKLYVILTQNLVKRKFFKNVLEHYNLLAHSNRSDPKSLRAFFYVSSSEWNLYNFIEGFTELHNFPKAVMKLKKIKSGPIDFIRTGWGDHDHKFKKIKNILDYYPDITFVLIGDDSQEDPFIYHRITDEFPHQVRAIYIRQTETQPKPKVGELLHNLTMKDIPACYYKLSARAIEHSQQIGLI